MFDAIMEDLPNFPDDVIRDWIEPFAQDEGWPPTAERWHYLLKKTDLDRWRAVDWELRDQNFCELVLSPSCTTSLGAMLRAYTGREENEYSRALGERGMVRFHVQLHHLIDHGLFPPPPVLVDHGEGLEIMDGNHRIAALCAWFQWKDNANFLEKLEKEPKPLHALQPVWIGTFET